MADAFRKSALAQNLRSGPAESKFTLSSYDDARAEQDAEPVSALAAGAKHSKPIVTLTHSVTRFDADSQQDVTFYVAEFNIFLINERIRFITRGTRRSVLSDLGGPAKESSSSSSSSASTPDSKAAAEQADEPVVDSIVCFIRYSHFEWFHTALVDLFPDAAFPLLPAKSYSLFRDNSAEFIEARRASLETWIRSVFESFPSVLISPPLAGLLKLR